MKRRSWSLKLGAILATLALIGVPASPVQADDRQVLFLPIGGAMVVTDRGALEEIFAFERIEHDRDTGQFHKIGKVVSRVPVPLDFAVQDIAPRYAGYSLLATDGTVWTLTYAWDDPDKTLTLGRPIGDAHVRSLPQGSSDFDEAYLAVDGGLVGRLDEVDVFRHRPAGIDLTDVVSFEFLGNSAIVAHQDGSVTSWGIDHNGLLSFPPALNAAKVTTVEACRLPVGEWGSFMTATTTAGDMITWSDVGGQLVDGKWQDGLLRERQVHNFRNPGPMVHSPLGCLLLTDDKKEVVALRVDGNTKPLADPDLPAGDNLSAIARARGAAMPYVAHDVTAAGSVADEIGSQTSLVAVSEEGRVVLWNQFGNVVHTSQPTDGDPIRAAASNDFSHIGYRAGRVKIYSLREVQLWDDPEIVGEAVVGSELEAKHGDFDVKPVSAAEYQWFRDGQPIEGATEKHYTLTEEDLGSEITVSVRGRIDVDDESLGFISSFAGSPFIDFKERTSAATAGVQAAPVVDEGEDDNSDPNPDPDGPEDGSDPGDQATVPRDSDPSDSTPQREEKPERKKKPRPDRGVPNPTEPDAPTPTETPEPAPEEPQDATSPDAADDLPEQEEVTQPESSDPPPSEPTESHDPDSGAAMPEGDEPSDSPTTPDNLRALQLAQLRAESSGVTQTALRDQVGDIAARTWWWVVPSALGSVILLSLMAFGVVDARRSRPVAAP